MATIGQKKAARAAHKAAGGGTGKLNSSDFIKQADGSYVNRNTGTISPYKGKPSPTKPVQTLTQGTLPTTPVAPKSTTVNSSNIAPVTPIALPDAQPPTYGGVDGAIEGVINQSQTIQGQSAQQPTAQENYLQAILEHGNISSSIDRTEQDKAKKESDRLTAELEQEQLANRRRIEKLQKNETGMLSSGIAVEEERLNRESFSKQADIAILQTAANRNYETAAAIADRQLEMKLEKSRANLEALKLLDQREYGEITLKKEREYKKLEETETAIKQLKLNVAQYGGSLGLLNQLSAIDTSKPGAFDEALRIAGKYASDPLDRAIKQAQLGKLQAGGVGDGTTGRKLSTTNYSKFTANPNYKAIKDGSSFQTALAGMKKAIEKYGTREVLSATGAGELNGAYQSLAASVKDYYNLGTLDAGVEKLIELGIPKPNKFGIRDKKVISAIDTISNQAQSNIQSAVNQLQKSIYGNTSDFQILLQNSVIGQGNSNTTISENDYVNSLLQVGSANAYNYFE